MPNPAHVISAIVARLAYEAEREQEIRDEMDKIAKHYNWYCDLMKQQAESGARLKRIGRLLKGSAGVVDPDALPEHALRKLEDIKKTEPDLPLWEAMVEYLSHVKEATIEDVQEFFAWMPFKETSRQAIESAIKRHGDVFRIKKRGKDRLISLKT